MDKVTDWIEATRETERNEVAYSPAALNTNKLKADDDFFRKLAATSKKKGNSCKKVTTMTPEEIAEYLDQK